MNRHAGKFTVIKPARSICLFSITNQRSYQVGFVPVLAHNLMTLPVLAGFRVGTGYVRHIKGSRCARWKASGSVLITQARTRGAPRLQQFCQFIGAGPGGQHIVNIAMFAGKIGFAAKRHDIFPRAFHGNCVCEVS